MSEIQLRRPISVGEQWAHKDENVLCEITSIWINTLGHAVIESMALDDNSEMCADSVSDFIKNYRFKG